MNFFDLVDEEVERRRMNAIETALGREEFLLGQPRKESFNYKEYLKSPTWYIRRECIYERSKGICERCKVNPHQHTHHLTYERIGQERLEDLLGVCKLCHDDYHSNE